MFLFKDSVSVAGVINVTCRGPAITAAVCLFPEYSGPSSAEESDEAEMRDEAEGSEMLRFKRRSILARPRGGVEAGNEVDDRKGVDGRVSVIERLRSFEGGVGGVDTHVGGVMTNGEAGGDDSPDSGGSVVEFSASPREMACPASERVLWEEIVDNGVQTGEAKMDGRWTKPHVWLRSSVRGQAEYLLSIGLSPTCSLYFVLRERSEGSLGR